MGGNENSIYSHFQSEEESQPVSGATSASPGTSADSDTLACHSPPAKKRRVFDFNDLCYPEDDNSKAAVNWRNFSIRMGMGVGGNGNNQWEWEGNGNSTRLSLGVGMGMNRWEW